MMAGNLAGQVVYTENSDAQFNAGSYSSTYLSSSSVMLDYYGRGSGLAAPGSDEWYSPDWKYRLALSINSANASSLASYPVPVTINTQALISAGRMKSDGSDIRFTTAAASGIPLALPYYIESGLNTSSTKIWVRHSGVATGANNVYMYYGNAAAAAASSMPGVFLLGDNFTGTDGAAPSSSTWASIQSAPPGSGSTRDIQSNQLRLYFGSPLNTRYFGLRSAAQYPFSSGRRYHAEMQARTTGGDSWTSFTLCPTVYNYSYDEQDWLRVAVHHSASGATYAIERSDYGSKTTLASGSLSAGMHSADLLITASSVTVLIDGAQVYSAANTLSFNSPYVYLEGATASVALDTFLFDNVSAQPYSPPEPAFGSAGAEQGRRYPSGTFVSQARDSGSPSRYTSVNWQDSLPAGATVTMDVRAHDTDVALATFSAVAKGGDPGVLGRYVQYRLNFSGTDPRYTAAVSSVTLTYGSTPLTPTGAYGNALSESSVRWLWTDNSSGQYQEDGFKVLDASGTVKGTTGANASEWTETGLYPNTQYTRGVAGFNAAGTGSSAAMTRYTLAVAPNVSCDKSTGTWLSGTLTCANLAGFGANGVSFYRYEWNQQPTKTWSGSEPQWTSSTLSKADFTTGNYYLHVKSYNGDGIPLTGYQTYGPFWYDKNVPTITGFSPSSAPWQNTYINPAVAFADTGGSKLYRVRHRWSTSQERPATGWQAYNYSVSGDSGTLSYTWSDAGQWYLHIEADDVAGNTGYAVSAGQYKMDFTKPSGGVTINGGDAYTASPQVTLSLTYADTESGVKNLAYKNLGGSYTAPELPQPTTSWSLSAGADGSRQVYLQITDNAGNTQQYADTISLDSRTTLQGEAVGATASGVMGETAETFTPGATLTWTPTGAPLSAKTISFHFGGSTKTAVTDLQGRAFSSFDVPQASGTYIYNVSFSTDGTYAATAATGSVTAAQRSSTLITEDVNATSNNPFIAKATLKDFYTSNLIAGATVNFYFEGSTQTAVTNAIGVATVTFTAPGPVGFYDYTAEFAGDSVYAYKDSVSRVGVGLRVTSLAVPPVASPAYAEFTAQATLMDGTSPVSGASVSFFFQGSTHTALTNASGIAVSTYSAPASSGTYTYYASFPGDGTYAASAGSALLTVTRRPLSLAGEIGQGYVDATFQARAVLYDGITAGKVEGKTIVFVFETSSAAVVTDANGVSTAVFNTGALPRSSTCYYYFSGDSGYNFADSTATVSIDRRPVSLSASDISAMVNSSFTVSAQLKDTAFTPAGIQGKTLTFSFGGSTQTAVTDAVGVASVTYQAGLSTGTYEYYVTFAQDGSYVAANDTGTVTMDKRPAVISAYPRFVFAFDTIQAVADLKDGVTGAYISSQPISFLYAGIAQSTVTDAAGGALGRAYAVYTGTGVAGTYSYSATFPGSSLYSFASSTASLTVNPRTVNLAAFPVTAIWATTFTATAEFRDGSNNALVSGKPVRLAFSTAAASGIMTAAGVAASTFTAPSSTGTFSWFANFSGDQAYAAAAATGTVTVTRRAPTITPIATTKYVWDSIILNATFTDDGAPVSGKTLTFVFNGDTKTAVTNAAGLATTVAFSSVSTPGGYSFTVSFPGDTNYSAQSASSTLTAVARLSSINVGPQSAIANSTITLSATLIDTNWTTGIAGKSVSFTLQGATFSVTALTNASGIATAGFYTASAIGPYTYSATFAGNTNYSGTSSSETLTVTLRPTALEMADYTPPAGSTFTVSAVLKDFATGNTIASKTVSFLFRSVTRTGITSALGAATTNYTALASTQSYPISASFAGDTLYAASSISKTVYPGKRNTSVQTSDLNTAVALDSFTVTARLSDYDLGTFLAGSTITFSFNATTYTLTGSAYTNSTGIASVSFRAPASTGSYTYTATYPGDALYNNTLNTSSILVNRRTPALNPSDITGVAATSTFTATALLSDAGLGVTLSTRTLTFVFSSTKNAVTDGVGVATTSLVAPVSTGTFVYKVTYGGDSLYTPATTYATIGVVLKPTVLEVLDVPDAVVNYKFTATAKLRDIELGNALVTSTKTITITFRPYAVTYSSTAVTSVGVATTSFIAPASTGTYGYTATFAGDSVYGASTSSGTVTVNRRPVLFGLTTNPSEPYTFRAEAPNSSFTVIGTLSDGQQAGVNIAGSTITFVFLNSTKTAITNDLGVASVTFASPASSGTYSYFGYFYGDLSYNPNRPEDSEKLVSIQTRPTYISPNYSGAPGAGSLMEGSYYAHTFNNFNVGATLFDSFSSQGIGGSTVSFVCLDSTRTGITSYSAPVGHAISSSPYVFVSTQNTYPCTVNFSGSPTYAPSGMPAGTNGSDNTTAKIVIYNSPAYFDLPSLTETYPDQDLVINGHLLDWWSRAQAQPYLVGYPFSYRICNVACSGVCDAADFTTCNSGGWSAWSNGVTLAGNVSTATVHTPAAAGDYLLGYTFTGTSAFYFHDNYGTTSPRVIRVGRRMTYILPDSEPITVGAQKPIDVTVKLIDLSQVGSPGINSKLMDVILVTTQTLTTGTGGGSGKVKATFAGMAVGTYTYIARFPDGDPAYMPFTSTGTIIVEKNITLLTAEDAANVPAGNSFQAKATLYISTGGTNTPLAGKTINFVFTSTAGPTIDLSAVTNAIGVATVTYWSPYVPANYNYTAEFTEDSDNFGSTDNSNTVQVVKRRTQTTAQNAAVYIGESFVSTATLTDLDLNNSTIPLKTISFVLHKGPDVPASALTNAIGVATVTYAAPASSGPFLFSATFPTDSLYAVSSDTKTLTASRRVTYLDAMDISTPTNTSFTMTATLKDVTFNLGVSTPIAGVTVRFVFNSQTQNGTTGADGKASVTFNSPATAAIYPYSANFDGNQTYDVTTTNRNVDVRKRNTFVSGYDRTAPSGAQFTATADLIDEYGQKLENYTLDFVFTGSTATYNGSGQTDVNGQASALFTAPLSTGNYNYTAAFAGDATYAASADNTNTVTVNVASTTLSVPDGSVVVNTLYYATATLRGAISGVGVANKTVNFAYPGQSLDPAVSDIAGKAYRPFTPASTGTFRLDATFDGDTAFYASAASATITVTRRTTGISITQPINTEVSAVFITTVTLRDYAVSPSTWVVGRTVDVFFDGTHKYPVTNAVGVATASFTAPAIGGQTYAVTATFAGDAVFESTNTAGWVNVAKRITGITVDAGSVPALEVFNATATLRWNGSPVAGKVINFSYKGSTLASDPTDAGGKAYLQFSAGASSGPWQVDASFEDTGDAMYAISSGSNTITVLQRQCRVMPDPLTISVFDTFTATATILDVVTAATPSGRTARMSFNWLAANSTGTTTASTGAGLVYYSTGAPTTAGTYRVESFFLGDATYAPSLTSTATVTVNKRPSLLAVANVSTIIDKVFTATATLNSLGTLLNNKNVVFTFEGNNFISKTNASGVAVATFTVTISTGANQIDAVFNGDSSYDPSNAATATVTAAMRPTFVNPQAASVYANKVFVTSATLADVYGSSVVARTLSFTFNGSNQNPLTSAVGLATASYTASVATGAYSVPVQFAGDYKYVASSATLSVNVLRRPTSLTSGGNITVSALDVFNATATLRDLDLFSLTSVPLRFVFQGSTFTKYTDGAGISVTTFTAPSASGAYSLYVYFDGDPTYDVSQLTIPVTVAKRNTGISLNPVSAKAWDVFKTTAALSDLANGALKVSTRTVTFSFSWTGSTSAVTDGVGVATAAYASTGTAGAYTLTGAFAGDSTYASTTTTIPLTVAKRDGFVIGIYISTRVLDAFTASATFYDSVSSAPVANRPVKFSLQSVSTLTAVTNAFGTASVNFTAPAASGTYNLWIWSDGPSDPTYNGSAVYTSSVTLARRNSRITLVSPPTIIINSTFTSTGTMYDSVSNGVVPSKNLAFLFQASTVTAATNGSGIASAGYTASLSSGTYGLQVSYPGDATYNPSFSSMTVTALRYPTRIAGPAVTVVMNEVLTATATLSDYLSATVPAKALNFSFQAQPFVSVTNVSGVAYSTYSAAVAAGAYTLPVSFAGDAVYDSTNTTLAVTVNKRTALVTPSSVTVRALNVFTATATLADLLNQAQKLAGETVQFQFTAGTSTYLNSGVTDVNGVAVSTFAAPASTGSYSYTASFAGNSTYYPQSAPADVAVTQRPVLLMQDNGAATIDEPFRSTATLVDQATLAPVAARTVLFTFGSSSAAATGADGRAAAGFTAPSSSGPYQLNSSFAGDATYAAGSSTATLTVIRRPVLMAAPDIAGIIDEVFTSTLTLSDAISAAKVTGRTAVFNFAAADFFAATNGSGVAVSTFAAPGASGVYYASINFAGDGRFLPNGTTVQLTVDRRPSGLSHDPVTARAGEIFTATATLADVLTPASKPSGKPLVFFFQGSSFTAYTNALGVAVSTFSAPPSSGSVRIDVSFAGDSRYQASASSATVAVLRRLSAIDIDPATIQAMDVLTSTATLYDKLNPAVYAAGRTITFTFRGEDSASVTDAGGMATASFAGPASSGTYLVEASFAGDGIYDSSYASGTVTVIQRVPSLNVADGSAYPFEVLLASSSMRDGATGVPIAWRPVSYTLNASSAAAITSAVGVATATYTPPAAFGNYELRADFAGDATYAAATASGTIAVLQRPTSVTPLDAAAMAMDVFTASATIYDVRLGTPIEAKELEFLFTTGTSTAATGADGQAFTQFSAPVSSGVYEYGVSFHGDSVYAASVGTAAVTVATRPTRVVARDKNANVGEPFTLSAQLLDPAKEDLPGFYVTNVPMKFVFKDRNNVKIDEGFGTTNELGIATITFSGPGAPDVYYYSATYEGGVTYSSSTATAMVKVGLLTSLVAFDVETEAMETFKVKAKLTDYLSTTLDDKPVRFKFIAQENSGMTNAEGDSGVASSTFTAPSSSGTYFYNAYFDGDSIYSASNATATITVKLRTASIVSYPASALAYSSFTAMIALRDLKSNDVIGGRDVDLIYNGSTVTVNTSLADGTASTVFFAPVSSGTLNFYARFYGDETYSPTSGTGTVTVSYRPTSILSYNVSDLLAGATFSARVQVKDGSNQPIPGLDVDFLFGGEFGVGATDAGGFAEAVFTAPMSSGTYEYYANFYGDDRYSASNGTGTVTIGPRPTLVFTPAASSMLGSPLRLSARLLDRNTNSGISGKTLSYYFDGSTVTAVTDEFGVSTASFSSPASTGSYLYEAEFVGDSVAYTGSRSSAPVTIALNLTSIEAASGLSIKIYEPLYVQATVRDSIGVQLQGLPVNFTFDGSVTTSVTDGIGKATATFPTTLLASTGTYNYEAEYPGDTLFVASADTANVVNVYRRESLLIARDAQSTPSKAVTVEARLYDNVNGSALAGAAVPGKDIVFELALGSYTVTRNAVTSAAGVSTATFVAPVSTGTFLLTARFADSDPVYTGYISSASLVVMLDDGSGVIRTKLKVENAAAYITHSFVATGTLTASDLPVPDKPVLFEFFNGLSTYTAAGLTNGVGLASATFSAPASSGVYQITATFGGDLEYGTATGTGTLTTSRFPSVLTAVDVAVFTGETFTAKAVLRDGLTSATVSTKTVHFSFFDGVSTVTKTAVTSSTGSAETTFTAPAVPGDYFYTATFQEGDPVYTASQDVASLLIASRGSSTFLVSYDVLIGTGEVFAASATLTSKGYPVPGKAVKFSFGGATLYSTTTAAGLAFSTFTAPASSGTFVCLAEFTGDLNYNAAEATSAVKVVMREVVAQPAVTEVKVTTEAVTMSWAPITVSSFSQVAGYVVEQAASLRGAVTVSTTVAASTAASVGYSIPLDPSNYTYIKITTKLQNGLESDTRKVIEVPPAALAAVEKPNYYYMSKETAVNDWAAWVKVPGAVQEKASAQAPLEIEVTKENRPEFLAAYSVTASGASETIAEAAKSADRRGVRLTIAYPKTTGVSAAGGQVAIYWHNGVEWVKLGGEIDVLTGEIYTYSRVLGQFAVRADTLASAFTLTKVAPRIFSPDEASTAVNRARFYFENPVGAEVTIRIFDITGALVRRNLESEGANIMFWNGKNQEGGPVKGGIYIYQIESGSKVITGTVVVAK